VTALTSAAAEPNFWNMLTSPVLEARVVRMAPAEEGEGVDDDYLDAIAAAFGQVVDAKSPFTAGHSARIAELTGRIGGKLGVEQARTRWLQRAAFLHDVGKLGVSSSILEKPSQLDDAEWVTMRDHASHTRANLSRIGALADFADIAAAHHERIDGKGYPLGLAEHQISRETRIITICDYYDALTADRPYRKALPIEEALRIIGGEVGSAIDQDCFHALKASI
jgi:HD-GYP domain-containing protein (c-di-GMP phosphodiesterase class II)